MTSIKEIVTGTIITLVIGGSAYTIHQSTVVDNFAQDTGMTTQQAQEYVESVKEEDLVEFGELGKSYTDSGKLLLNEASGIDCENYYYEWETTSLDCYTGKQQLYTIGNQEVKLGNSYVELSKDTASRQSIQATITELTLTNETYKLPIFSAYYDEATVTDSLQTNSYNKALLQAALDSE